MTAVELYKSCEAIGIKAWSDDTLSKVLAWATVAGFPECTVQEPLHSVLSVAAYRFNIGGGLVPNIELMKAIYYPKVRELKRWKEKTVWLPALMERYKVTGWQSPAYFEWGDEL